MVDVPFVGNFAVYGKLLPNDLHRMADINS